MEPSPDDPPRESEFWACNIDRKGRNIRLLAAFVLLASASWLWWGMSEAFWSIGLLSIGLLASYEGLRGWCVLRALGGQTPF